MKDGGIDAPQEASADPDRQLKYFLFFVGGFAVLGYLVFQAIWIAEYLGRIDASVRNIDPACYVEERWQSRRNAAQKAIHFLACDQVNGKINEIRDDRGTRFLGAEAGPAGLATLAIRFKGNDVLRQIYVQGPALEFARETTRLPIRPLEWSEQRVVVIMDWKYPIAHVIELFEDGIKLWHFGLLLGLVTITTLLILRRKATMQGRPDEHGSQ